MDERIKYLGWKTGEELNEYLCACDLYCQPGTVSASLQNAICHKCSIMSYPHREYKKHLDWGNIIWVESEADMLKTFLDLKEDDSCLTDMKYQSERCASELLDYHVLASKIYI